MIMHKRSPQQKLKCKKIYQKGRKKKRNVKEYGIKLRNRLLRHHRPDLKSQTVLLKLMKILK